MGMQLYLALVLLASVFRVVLAVAPHDQNGAIAHSDISKCRVVSLEPLTSGSKS